MPPWRVYATRWRRASLGVFLLAGAMQCAASPPAISVGEVSAPPGSRVPASALSGPVRADRVLLKTGTFPDPTHFNEDFAALSPELVDHLSAGGVRLVGLDTPSVDPFASKDLPAHNACLRHDIGVLEGVVLDAVPEGVYELIALPLRLVGYDGSPVRAILRDLPVKN